MKVTINYLKKSCTLSNLLNLLLLIKYYRTPTMARFHFKIIAECYWQKKKIYIKMNYLVWHFWKIRERCLIEIYCYYDHSYCRKIFFEFVLPSHKSTRVWLVKSSSWFNSFRALIKRIDNFGFSIFSDKHVLFVSINNSESINKDLFLLILLILL